MKYRYLCKFLLNCGTKTKNDNTSNVQNRMLSLYHSVLQHNTKPGPKIYAYIVLEMHYMTFCQMHILSI